MYQHGTLGELIEAVLATGRLSGGAEAAELWCLHISSNLGRNWDANSTRLHTRMLRKAAQGNEIDELTAEYVSEMTTLKLALAKHGVQADTPGDIEGWFRGNAKRDSYGRMPKPQVSAQPDKPRRTLDDATDAMRYALLGKEKP